MNAVQGEYEGATGTGKEGSDWCACEITGGAHWSGCTVVRLLPSLAAILARAARRRSVREGAFDRDSSSHE